MKNKKPLTILFDANPMVISGKSGVGYFTNRMIAALAAEYPNDLRLVGHYFNFLGRKKNPDLVYAPNVTYKQTRLVPGKVFNGLRRKLGIQIPFELLARRKADLLLFPNFALAPSLFHVPRAVAIHDLYFTKRPEHINSNNIDFLQKFVPAAARNADLVIAISDFTRSEIMATYGVPESKILTIPIPPLKPTIVAEKKLYSILKNMDVSGGYLLFVGNIEPRKNLVPLIKAYTLLADDLRKKYSLVLAGGKGWNDSEILTAIDAAKQAGYKIITPGYVSDEQKAALYQGATLFVMPSHYEGFGMQLLEAMSYHVPNAVSDIPVFHEVAHDAAAYFDQDDPKSIAKCLDTLLRKPSERTRLVHKADEELKQYNWSNVAKAVHARIVEVTRGEKNSY